MQNVFVAKHSHVCRHHKTKYKTQTSALKNVIYNTNQKRHFNQTAVIKNYTKKLDLKFFVSDFQIYLHACHASS